MKTIGLHKPRRALVIGASMAGLFATALLRRAGWDAEVYEALRARISACAPRWRSARCCRSAFWR